MHEVRRIGYWRNDRHPEFPDPSEFSDPKADEKLLERVGLYLATGTIAAAYVGSSTCRICGDLVGSREFTDGVYRWAEGLAHYVRKHRLRLPPEFELHAEGMLDQAESQSVDDSWWRKAMVE